MFLLRLESVVLPPSELLKGTWSSKLKQLMPFDGQRLQEEMIQAVDDSGVLRDHLDEEGRVHMRRFLKNLLSDSYMVWDIVKGQVMYSGQQGGDIEELEDYELEHSCAFKQHSRVRRRPCQLEAESSMQGTSSSIVNQPSSPTTP